VPRHAERSLGRQLAFQFLFSLEFVDTPWRQALTEFWHIEPVSLTGNTCEDGEEPAADRSAVRNADTTRARRCAEEFIEGVCERKETLDTQIAASLNNWKPERVGRIEWVIMRLALYELLYCPATPTTVVIAEAMQLADVFGDAESPRFVNGLLDKLASSGRRCDGDNAGGEIVAP